MEEEQINLVEKIQEYICSFRKNNSESRNIKLYTGIGGFDVFNEAMEHQTGFVRIYMGNKKSRILNNRLIKYSEAKKKYYRLWKEI